MNYLSTGMLRMEKSHWVFFPRKDNFDGVNFRTARIDEAEKLIFNIGAGFGEIGDGNAIGSDNGKTSSGSKLTKKSTFHI